MKLDITSPCRGICKIDEPSQLCSGCLRSIDEITRWRQMDSDQKLAVLSACLDRQQIPISSDTSRRLDKPSNELQDSASEGCE